MVCRVLALSLCSTWLSCSDDSREDVVPWEIPQVGASPPSVLRMLDGGLPPLSFIDAAVPSIDAGGQRDASIWTMQAQSRTTTALHTIGAVTLLNTAR